ncbi:MAG: hypothetical protein RIR62_2566 [Pseudomonadota bacterium]|jgi:hypothetical protein
MRAATALLSHAAALMLRDPKATVRVTVLPYLLAHVPLALLPDADTPRGMSALVLGMAAEFAFLAAIAWMAVAWHRFVLAGESGWPLPPAPVGRVAAYAGWVAVFEIAVIAVSALAIWSVSLSGQAGDGMLSAAFYLLIFAAAVLFGRLGAILPAVALGPVDRILDGWRATRGATGALALCYLVVLLAEEAAFHIAAGVTTDTGLSQVLQALLAYPAILSGIALLTATYLRYVRPAAAG